MFIPLWENHDFDVLQLGPTWMQVWSASETLVQGEKSVHCLYKTHSLKVSMVLGFLGNIQNRRRLILHLIKLLYFRKPI